MEPDLLLLDMVMPVLDGIGVLEGLDKASRPKVAIFSAIGRDDITARAMALGADSYFIKPFDYEVLKLRLAQMFARNPAYAQEERMRNWEQKAIAGLHEMAVPPHIRGYRYLQMAIAMVLENGGMVDNITIALYEPIARQFGTTPSRVERSMRHAVEKAWDRSTAQRIERIFGYTVDMEKSKPSNREFIAMLADRIILRETAERM